MWEDQLTLFVAYLIKNNKKSATIKSYVSAIKAVLMEDGIEINENRYLISALTRACRYKNDAVRVRLPIHKDLLHIVLRQIDFTFLEDKNQPYLAALYKAMLATTYYGLLRVGEVAKGTHPVLAKDIHIGQNKNKILLVLRTSKTHWLDVKPQFIKISSVKQAGAKKNVSIYCPFTLIRSYLKKRVAYKDDLEQFFIFRDRLPVTAANIRIVLRNALERGGFDPRLYNMHGIRAGRAVDLQKLQVPIPTIKSLGRWRSNAVFTYLKNC